MIAIRGATTISENTVEGIKSASLELFQEIIKQNNLCLEDIVSVIFSCTEDITKDYPGKHIREHFMLNSAAIMHFNEMKVDSSLPLCIRVMLHVNQLNNNQVKFVYLRGASNLRKDLTSNQ